MPAMPPVPDLRAAPAEQDGERVRLRLAGPLALIEFFNPVNDCFDARSEAELAAALDRLERVDTLRAVVLTGGTEGVFIRHYDLPTLEQAARRLQAKGASFSCERPVPEAPFQTVVRRLADAPYVTIAAINGTAMGGGLELALACDIRVAQAGDFPLGFPELALGILPGAGGTLRLPLIVGAGRALYNLLTSRMFTPAEAQGAGLVDECVADALARATQIALHVTTLPARACRHAKQLVRSAGALPFETSLSHERTLMCDCLTDPEASARIAAALQSGQGLERFAPAAGAEPVERSVPD